MHVDLVWADPPPPNEVRRGKNKSERRPPEWWQSVASQLKARPNEWAIAAQYPTHQRNAAIVMVSHIRHRQIVALGEGEWRAVCRQDDCGYLVYMRCLDEEGLEKEFS